MNTPTGPTNDSAKQLRQFLNWLLPFSLIVSALLLFSLFFFSSMDNAIAGVAVFSYALLLLWGRALLERGKIQTTIIIVSGGLFALALGITLMAPSSALTLILLPIMAITVTLPYVSGQALRRISFMGWLISVIMAILAMLDRHSEGLVTITSGILLTVGMALLMALIVLLLWQFSYRLTTMLVQTQAANDSLQAAHSKQAVHLAQLLHDIAERKKAEEALRQSEEQFRLTFEDAPIGMAITTIKGRFLRVNQSLCTTMDYSAEELLTRSFADITHPDDLTEALAMDRRLMKGEMPFFQVERRYIGKDGRIVTALLHMVLVCDRHGDPLHFIGQIVDMTERKQAEEQRREMERKLLETQKLESVGVLAGGIAHDFNNMLMGILGNASLVLLDLPPDSPAYAGVAQIEVTAQRAADLTQQMLAYAGKGRFIVQQIDLNALIRETSQLLNASVTKNAMLHYQLAPALPMIEGDITQIRQVVMNLIVNASEAIGDQSGTITISTNVRYADQSYLAASAFTADLAEGKYIVLTVSDSGCGMDEETQAKIFEPFFTTKFTGRGLGLAAVQGIVRSHTGALTVASTPGQGTTFTILLPCAARQVERPAAPPPMPVALPRGAETVLVVDDEADVRMVAELMLKHLGFTVILARNGQAAIELFRAHAGTIACVLLDLTMPHMDGEEVFQELRAIDPAVQVVLMSGYSEHEVSARFDGQGLAGFLQKPFALAVIQQKLQQVLANAPTEQDAEVASRQEREA